MLPEWRAVKCVPATTERTAAMARKVITNGGTRAMPAEGRTIAFRHIEISLP
jgi:hypothetical protein